MKCPQCGETNSARRDVCRSCGKDLPETAATKKSKHHAQIDVSARYEYASAPTDDPPHMGVMLEIEGAGQPIVRRSQGAVAHVILALDLSASMNDPDKYPVLREAVGSMLDDLQAEGAADVLVSVVIFSMGAEVLIRGQAARRIGREPFFEALENSPMCFGRYTDVAGALSRAGRIAFDQVKSNPLLPTRIYLLTDGRPQDVDAAREVAEKVSRVRCDVHALAFGADADVKILQDMLGGRRGGTVKAVRRETIGSAFERVAEVAQRVIATRCMVTVDLAPGVVGGDAFRYRPARVQFPEPAFADGKTFEADLGTIEMGRTYSLLFEVRPQEAEHHVSTLGEVTVQIPGIGGPITETVKLMLDRTPSGTDLGRQDKAVRTARDILGALTDEDPQTAARALRLRRALYKQEKRDPGLISILDKAIDLLETTGSLDALSPGDYATLLAHTCTSGIEADRALGVS